MFVSISLTTNTLAAGGLLTPLRQDYEVANSQWANCY